MAKLFDHLPELEGEEALYIQRILESMDDDTAKTFSNIYRARRKDPMTILILAIIGFFGVAGIHRIFIGHPGMGILYLLTAGLCFIGTIVDVINYKNLTFENNRETALEILKLMN
ncbi:MAG: TM2 domain-containing protein [Balneolaceae bacterium]